MRVTKENKAIAYEFWRAVHVDDASNFTVMLFRLIQKADQHNILKLSIAYPLHVKCFREWQQSVTEADFFSKYGIDVRTGVNIKNEEAE